MSSLRLLPAPCLTVSTALPQFSENCLSSPDSKIPPASVGTICDPRQTRYPTLEPTERVVAPRPRTASVSVHQLTHAVPKKRTGRAGSASTGEELAHPAGPKRVRCARFLRSAQAAQARHQRARNSPILPGRSESVVRGSSEDPQRQSRTPNTPNPPATSTPPFATINAPSSATPPISKPGTISPAPTFSRATSPPPKPTSRKPINSIPPPTRF